MNPMQALEMICKAASLAPLVRQDHINIEMATKILMNFISDNMPKQEATVYTEGK